MNRYKDIAVLSMLLLLLLSIGCTKDTRINVDNMEGKDVIAIVNGEKITGTDIEKEIEDSRYVSMVVEAFAVGTIVGEDSQIDTAESLLGLDKTNLSAHEIRYLEDIRRKEENKILEDNEAFNKIIRRKVLYQEAQNHLPMVSTEEALKTLQQMEETSRRNLEEADEDLAAWYQEAIEIENAIAQEFGYDSASARRKARADDLAVSMTISKLKGMFEDKLMRKNPDIQGIDLVIYAFCMWEDYTEFLLRAADIQQIHHEYEINFYGNQWEEEIF
ncbi:hypothetical protein SAMN05660297_02859 [Natronincola peptidivorans]|uniref:SurA N-terminal domain-containing protein n=1 Tax=Natronincola peptidivorans TaxID=426128 RepID=A0A1I0FM71_9FIRM|nr:hypothetical protein [Natronincola peptidivorans]SET59217.1 hypothetical protein SAMN05660297_02859 [Natronincola peptidivorans]